MISILENVPASELRLEVVRGLTIWEAMPVLVHQERVDFIRATIRPRTYDPNICKCFHYADLSMRFPDGSQKRPDIAIFCERPKEEREAVTMLPEAVIEVVSEDYEAKDYQIGLPFYLAEGVKDIIIYNPADNSVLHCRPDGTRNEMTSPVEIDLVCGCTVTV